MKRGGGERSYWRRVVEVARQRWRLLLAYAAVLSAVEFLREMAVLPISDARWIGAAAGWNVPGYLAGPSLLLLPPLFVAFVMSEALDLRGMRHAVVSFAAILVAIVGPLVVLRWAQGGVLNPVMVRERLIVSDSAFIMRTVWMHLATAMLLVAYFAIRTREAESARLAHEAEEERTRTERATMAARLKVIQARVEPALLFGVLADVRNLYERAPAEADALLDDLIGYLRAALPQMRGEASTLGQEAALAAAYVKVLPKGRRGELVAERTFAPEAARLPFPPMVLLPLVQGAAESSATRIAIELDERSLAAVSVTVEPARIPEGWTEDRLAPLRSTLRTYFGPGAGLDLEAARATIRWV